MIKEKEITIVEKDYLNDLKQIKETIRTSQNNLSQHELATLLGINQYNISFWEISRSEPNIEQIIKISEILKVPTDYLLGKDVILTSSEEEFQTVTNHFKQDIEDEMLNELISLYSSISNEKKKDLLQLVKSLTNLSK